MMNEGFKKPPLTRPGAGIKSRPQPRLFLNLHTMPQTAENQFKKWLILAALIFGLFILILMIIFW